MYHSVTKARSPQPCRVRSSQLSQGTDTHLLNQAHPCRIDPGRVCGPNVSAAGGAMAAQVSKAGGLGFIGARNFTPDRLRAEGGKVYDVFSEPKRGHDKRLKIAIGFWPRS